jgi:hypothetical protein
MLIEAIELSSFRAMKAPATSGDLFTVTIANRT